MRPRDPRVNWYLDASPILVVFMCLFLSMLVPTTLTSLSELSPLFSLPSLPIYYTILSRPDVVALSGVMPPFCFQDCHYFYRTALRGLNISTNVSPLYA
ncbi:uncharacterized protein CLUP02_01075 [Colletotrichum lupini]|uniref:Uncharacterized protein n=1 Tax=Colletotrichum lupini TaxID=145971 RepID=A0A9Q8W8U2_9PEZI|nr:uncharacterized protein CLUP02_01075 [Colletotrichum lupini]UQC74424.1 hypothetical protein CLUP02_01075 [Colletotrichum lupini]